MMGVNLNSESKPSVRGINLVVGVGEEGGVTVLYKCHSGQFVPANCSRKRLLSGFCDGKPEPFRFLDKFQWHGNR